MTPRPARLWPALLLPLSAACADPPAGEDFFPIGIYQVPDAAALPILKDAGFNAVHSANRDPAFLAALARQGLRLLPDPGEPPDSAEPMRRSLAAWYLYDEPDVHDEGPQALCARNGRFHARFPGTPTAFVVGDGRAAARYASCGDILMVDWYPVPHLPLKSLGDHVRLTEDAAGGKPVWAVIQAMNWKEYPQNDAKRPRVGRFPDASEIRFMSYDALYNGARGLWYYAYGRPGGSALPDTPEEWLALAHVSREMAAMRSVFQYGKPIPLPFQPDPDGVATRGWRWRGRDYVVILNRRGDVDLRVPEVLLDWRWRPLFETRRDARELLDHIGAAYYLRPYGVMVFESRLWPR